MLCLRRSRLPSGPSTLGRGKASFDARRSCASRLILIRPTCRSSNLRGGPPEQSQSHCIDHSHVLRNALAISRCGACLLIDCIIPAKTPLRIIHPGGELKGKVTYWMWQELGYVVGVEFDPDCRWSHDKYQPQHLYDPGD